MAAKDQPLEINSYLYEVFRLNPEYSDIYGRIIDEDSNSIKMSDFMERHYPKSPLVTSLESALAPYINAKEIFASATMRYKEALEKTDIVDSLENLSREQQTQLKRAKEEVPELVKRIKEAEETFKQEQETLHQNLEKIVDEINKIESGKYETRREFVYKMLDNLEIPRTQFKDKKIDNPLRFQSYDEAYDYMERQTEINRTKIPIKNWQNAATDYKIFEQLIIYLGLVDCLLPLGIDYGK